MNLIRPLLEPSVADWRQAAWDRQVILFSQEPEVLEWSRAQLTFAGDRLVELAEAALPV